MLDFRPIAFVLGVLLTILAAAMMIPAIVDLANGNPDWQVFVTSASVTLFIGVTLHLTSRGNTFDLKPRQAFLLTVLSWVVIAAFGALPFALSTLGLSYTDAFFESMSGVTTTGSTVLTGLDLMAPGLLLWRALLQWLGGIGIIVMALSIMPLLRVGGMQLFRMESSDTSEKVLPRAAQIASSIGVIYLILTILCAIFYVIAGMTWFDGIAHAMTTIATGGFSTSDSSVGLFNSAAVEYVATGFMIMGGLPFVLYLRAVRGTPQAVFQDTQVRWFLAVIATAVLTMTAYLMATVSGVSLTTALRLSAFNVVSVITGTGYSTDDFGLWGNFALGIFFFLMFIGGCAGSTTCGIKIFRFQVLYSTSKTQLAKLLHPHGVFIPYYNRKPIPDAISESVMSFFFMYMVCFAFLALALGLIGLDFLTAVSGAATAISNVGPGLGPIIGPAGTFAPLPDTAKWLLSFGMLLGRLELFTVLILLTPAFWQR